MIFFIVKILIILGCIFIISLLSSLIRGEEKDNKDKDNWNEF